MDRRDFILHTAAAVAGAVIGKTEVENEPAVAPDKIVETKGTANFDPWHIHWEQPMTRLTEKEAMGQVALGTPLFDPMMTPVDCGQRPLIMEQKLHGLPEPIYYLMGNAFVEFKLHDVVVARSPYSLNVGVNDVIGPNTWQPFVQATRDLVQKRDTPQLRALAEWICLNVYGSTGWEQILEHYQKDWLAGVVLDVRVRNTLHVATDDAKALWNAKFRDALTHGPNRK